MHRLVVMMAAACNATALSFEGFMPHALSAEVATEIAVSAPNLQRLRVGKMFCMTQRDLGAALVRAAAGRLVSLTCCSFSRLGAAWCAALATCSRLTELQIHLGDWAGGRVVRGGGGHRVLSPPPPGPPPRFRRHQTNHQLAVRGGTSCTPAHNRHPCDHMPSPVSPVLVRPAQPRCHRLHPCPALPYSARTHRFMPCPDQA